MASRGAPTRRRASATRRHEAAQPRSPANPPRRRCAMCFKNLPIEFDEQGRAHLKEGVANPYAYPTSTAVADQQDRVKELLARNGHIKDVSIDPVTRVA